LAADEDGFSVLCAELGPGFGCTRLEQERRALRRWLAYVRTWNLEVLPDMVDLADFACDSELALLRVAWSCVVFPAAFPELTRS